MAHFKTRSKNKGWFEGRLMHPNLHNVIYIYIYYNEISF